MKKCFLCLVLLFGLGVAFADPPAPIPTPPAPVVVPPPLAAKKHRRGAKRTPAHKIASAIANGSLKIHRVVKATPPQFAMVPKQMSMWLNDVDGDCVTAEEAAAVAEYTTAAGTEYFVQDATVLAFCNKYDLLNGADLLSVMQEMESDGFHQGADVIQDGASSVVDFSNESVLQNAISQGPVKIGIDSSALPAEAGNGNGWSAFGGMPQQFGNEDHCVDICGYGPTKWLADQLGVQVVSGAPANGYLVYTWDSIGIVDHGWLMSTCGEAYLRGPFILNGKALPPLSPTPPTPPTPVPVPPTPPTPTPTGNLFTLTTDASGVLTFTPAAGVILTPDKVQAIQDILNGAGKPNLPPMKKPEAVAPPPPSPVKPVASLAPAPATIIVSLPACATLTIDGAATTSTASERAFESPVLQAGKDFHYTLKAQIVRDGKSVVVSKEVTVRAGEETRVAMGQ